MPVVRVITGPAGSGKTDRLLDEYRRAVGDSPPGSTLWLAPTRRGTAYIRERLLTGSLRACFRPGVITFAQFARSIVDHAPHPIRRVSTPLKRELLRRVVERAEQRGELRHFRPIAHTAGLIDLVAGFLSELKRLEIWPEQFYEACRNRAGSGTLSDKDRELAAIYQHYQQLLTDHQLYDDEGLFWSARTYLREGRAQRVVGNLRLVVADGFTDFTWTQHEILEILAQRAGQMVISLPMEQDAARRPELFTKPHMTLDELRKRHGLEHLALDEVSTDPLASPPAAPPASPPRSPKGKPAPPAAAPTGFARLERWLFADPRAVVAGGDPAGIEIIEAAGQLGELREVAGRIKALLVHGDPDSGRPVRPDDIVVVLRSLAEAAPLVREVFAEFGIPLALDTRPALAEAPVLRALVQILELDRSDWPFRQLIAVVQNEFFQPAVVTADLAARNLSAGDAPAGRTRAGRPTWRAATQRLLRSLQIPSGREPLLRRVEQLVTAALRSAARSPGPSGDLPPGGGGAEGSTSPSSPGPGSTGSGSPAEANHDADQQRFVDQRRQWALEAWPVLRALSQTLAALPERATPAEWAAALDQVRVALGLVAPARDGASPAEAAAAADDCIAWQAQGSALGRSEDLSHWLGEPPPCWTRDELLDRLAEVLADEVLPAAWDETGRVRVLSAAGVRTLHVPYLFLAGLAEQAFPPRHRDDPIYNEAQRRGLNEAGLRLPDRAERAAAEMLLFYEVVTRARRRLYLSYPALDERAQPLLASPYLADVERIFGPQGIARSTVGDLRPVPRGAEPRSPSDLRVLAVHEALYPKDAPPSRGPLALPRAASEAVCRALAAVASRAERDAFGPFEGMLLSDAARAVLARRYGPEYRWSPSRLEQYALCPFRFFMQHVLRLEPLEDVALASDALVRGRILHDALAAVHRQMSEAAGPDAPSAFLPEQFVRGFVQQVDALFAQLEHATPGDEALAQIDRLLLHDLAELYVEQYRAYDGALPAPLAPRHFEVSFGLEGARAASDPLSSPEPLRVGDADDALLVAGRIDRIDLGQIDGQVVFNVIDYKSGRGHGFAKSPDELDPTRMQLEIYSLAAEQLLAARGAAAYEAGYWLVQSDKGYCRWVRMHEPAAGQLHATDAWTNRKKQLVEKLVELVRAAQQGQFPVHSADDDCTGSCAYARACRVQQVRSLEKTWQPPTS